MCCGDKKLSKYLTQTFIAHCNAMICHQVTLSGDAEWPKVADAVIEAASIYHPELLTCLHCGDLLVTCNYLAWDKTVQTLEHVLSIATRPGRCPHAACPGSRLPLLSAQAQRMGPAGSTYGYDVLVRIGWLRQHQRATYGEIHTDLAATLRLSPSHVRYLSQQFWVSV